MVLSDRTIRELIEAGRLRVDPYDPLALQPSSIDIRLDRRFRIFRSTRYTHIDPRQEQPELTELVTVGDGEAFVLQPGPFCLGNTWEEITLPAGLARPAAAPPAGRLAASGQQVPGSE